MAASVGDPPFVPCLLFVSWMWSGAYAEVFLYREEATERRVAVKVLQVPPVDDDLRLALRAGRVHGARLDHPHIVPVLSAGLTSEERPYVVMPFYPGPSLDTTLRMRQYALHETLRVGIQVGSGLAFAHRAGVLHQEVRPTNVLTNVFGTPGLTDFRIPGTPPLLGFAIPWSAPEIIEGGPPHMSADVYSLCATLWQTLTRQIPYSWPDLDNSLPALTHRIFTRHLAPLQRSDVPSELEALLLAGLSHEAGERPSLAEVLTGFQRIEHEQGYPPTSSPPATSSPDGLTPAPQWTDQADRDQPLPMSEHSGLHDWTQPRFPPHPHNLGSVAAPAASETLPAYASTSLAKAHSSDSAPPSLSTPLISFVSIDGSDHDPLDQTRRQTSPQFLAPIAAQEADSEPTQFAHRSHPTTPTIESRFRDQVVQGRPLPPVQGPLPEQKRRRKFFLPASLILVALAVLTWLILSTRVPPGEIAKAPASATSTTVTTRTTPQAPPTQAATSSPATSTSKPPSSTTPSSALQMPSVTTQLASKTGTYRASITVAVYPPMIDYQINDYRHKNSTSLGEICPVDPSVDAVVRLDTTWTKTTPGSPIIPKTWLSAKVGSGAGVASWGSMYGDGPSCSSISRGVGGDWVAPSTVVGEVYKASYYVFLKNHRTATYPNGDPERLNAISISVSEGMTSLKGDTGERLQYASPPASITLGGRTG